jgi:hypothetical protein
VTGGPPPGSRSGFGLAVAPSGLGISRSSHWSLSVSGYRLTVRPVAVVRSADWVHRAVGWSAGRVQMVIPDRRTRTRVPSTVS